MVSRRARGFLIVAATALELPKQAIQSKPRSALAESWRRFARNRPALLGLFVVVVLLFTAAFAHVIAPYSYSKTDLDNIEAPPSPELTCVYSLGTFVSRICSRSMAHWPTSPSPSRIVVPTVRGGV